MSDFDVFLSYRRSDGSAAAKSLARRLSSAHTRVPGKPKRLKVYLDRMNARADLNFYEQTIRPALFSARWLLVLVTPDSQARPDGTEDWIAREIADFSRFHGVEKIRMALVKGDTVPKLPGGLSEIMTQAQHIDLRGMRGFISSNRAQEDWENLLATLFEVPDKSMPLLRREQEKQRQNLMATVVGGAVGAATFATVLSGYAIFKTAESRQLLNRTAAVVSVSENGGCGALRTLWDAGATKRAVPAMECLIKDADAQWFAGNKFEARELLGTWDAFAASFQGQLKGLDYEAEEARLQHAMNTIWFDHDEVTKQDLFDSELISEEGLPTALKAVDQIETSFGVVQDLNAAYQYLDLILWPLINGYERVGQEENSLILMKRVFQFLKPNAELILDIGSNEIDDPKLVEFALIARRIAYFELGNENLAEAEVWSDQAIAVFGAFPIEGAWETYQHALAHFVRAQVVSGLGSDNQHILETALGLAYEAAKVATPPDEQILSLIGEIEGALQ